MLILCPVYKASENVKLNFNYQNFIKEIIIKSKVKLIMINNEIELVKFIKQNIFNKELVIGMGAGSISNWMKLLPNRLL